MNYEEIKKIQEARGSEHTESADPQEAYSESPSEFPSESSPESSPGDFSKTSKDIQYSPWTTPQDAMQKAGYVAEETAYVADNPKQQGEYTLEDYYAIPENRRVELIDGVIYDMSAPGFVHQHLVSSFFGMLLKFFGDNNEIDGRQRNCIPMVAPLDVNLDCDDKTMVQPDVLILCDRKKIRRWGIYGNPEFCLEVLSESTKRKDCIKKLQKYIEAGVKEYWILDPFRMLMMTYCWKDDYTPHMYPLEGKLGMELYDGKLQIDMVILAELIVHYPEI